MPSKSNKNTQLACGTLSQFCCGTELSTLFLLIYFLCCSRCLFARLYSIIAPNTVRPNSQYHVAVSLHQAVESARIKVGILSSSYTDFKTVEMRPFSTQLLHFEVSFE